MPTQDHEVDHDTGAVPEPFASEPSRADRAAAQRDVAAAARDEAAEVRDSVWELATGTPSSSSNRLLASADRAAAADAGETQRAEGDRRSAARDRAAAAADREQAAQDRHGSAGDLQNAYRDELTGALVRHAGWDQLTQAVSRAHRTGEPLVLALLDVDHLKQHNDERGHAFGDLLLREVGSALRHGLRSYDVVMRYGGDEFVCGLTDVSLAQSERRFTSVSEVLAEAVPGASVSVGLAALQQQEDLGSVINRADHEMYEGRRARRL
ncbi:MAG: GGDEF domain-containing protein [Actinomycetota bacterium]|nr:GGDEF domain-containing protein [Actinomycetota bacterium]